MKANARQEPKQERSIDSMSRMLDAGEALFLEGGAANLKLNLIIERAGTSTGSFYARFIDMQGFLDALHERALDRISESLKVAIEDARKQTALNSMLETFLTQMVRLIREYRPTIYYFAVASGQRDAGRETGKAFTLWLLGELRNLMATQLLNPDRPAVRRRLDFLTRTVSAMSFQLIMFDQEEISELELSDEQLVREWTLSLVASVAEFAKP